MVICGSGPNLTVVLVALRAALVFPLRICSIVLPIQVVVFCCGKCKAAFEAEPAKFADKLPKAKPTSLNSKCPVSGGDVDEAVTSEHAGRKVAFCCGKCKAAFDAEPAKFAGKLKD